MTHGGGAGVREQDVDVPVQGCHGLLFVAAHRALDGQRRQRARLPKVLGLLVWWREDQRDSLAITEQVHHRREGGPCIRRSMPRRVTHAVRVEAAAMIAHSRAYLPHTVSCA